MKYLKYKCLLAIILGCSLSGCFDLTEEVFDRVDSGVYYQDENSVKSAVATIYSTGAMLPVMPNISGTCKNFLPIR